MTDTWLTWQKRKAGEYALLRGGREVAWVTANARNATGASAGRNKWRWEVARFIEAGYAETLVVAKAEAEDVMVRLLGLY